MPKFLDRPSWYGDYKGAQVYGIGVTNSPNAGSHGAVLTYNMSTEEGTWTGQPYVQMGSHLFDNSQYYIPTTHGEDGQYPVWDGADYKWEYKTLGTVNGYQTGGEDMANGRYYIPMASGSAGQILVSTGQTVGAPQWEDKFSSKGLGLSTTSPLSSINDRSISLGSTKYHYVSASFGGSHRGAIWFPCIITNLSSLNTWTNLRQAITNSPGSSVPAYGYMDDKHILYFTATSTTVTIGLY